MSATKQSAIDGVKWAIERTKHFENECLMEEYTDTGELWDWVALLIDKAETLVDVASD
jgi:hypothetical protein